MSDYNRGTLSEPCMRLPYGFGGDWASIELGDGTGYVKLSEYEKVASDNVKLRELCSDMRKAFIHHACYRWCEHMPEPCNGACQYLRRMRELGIEVEQ